MRQSNAPVAVRPSRDADVPSIAAIYAYYVLNSDATFETEPPSPEEIGTRRAGILAHPLPHLVAEVDGAIVGFAYASPYRARAAYRYTVEDSVYIHPDRLRRGYGKRLLATLIENCESLGLRQMIAVIGGAENTASVRLHESLGFSKAGVLHSVGFKFERWVDTVLMQRGLVPIR